MQKDPVTTSQFKCEIPPVSLVKDQRRIVILFVFGYV